MAILLATASAAASASASASAVIVWAGIAPAFSGAEMVVNNVRQQTPHSTMTVAEVSSSAPPPPSSVSLAAAATISHSV